MTRRIDQPCPFGSHRSMEPESTLPQLAWRLDTALPIRSNEMLIRAKLLNINAASFSQLRDEVQSDPEMLIQKVQDIVSLRGKMHNPITGSGGTLMGVVEEIGQQHPARSYLKPGDQICTLVSLSLTPLVIESVKSVNMETGQIELEGYSILFETGIYSKVPPDIPANLFLAVASEAGSAYQANLLCSPGMVAMVVGASGIAGLLSLFAIKHKLGSTGTLIAIAEQGEDLDALQQLSVFDRVVAADMSDPLAAYRAVRGTLEGQRVDLVVDCSSRAGSEMFGILMVRERGTVYFANPAAQYSSAGLGAEGIGKELNLLFYCGYIPGHVTFCRQLLQDYAPLEQHLRTRYDLQGSGSVYYPRGDVLVQRDSIPPNIIIHGAEMTEILRIAKRIAPFNTTVLITGETGTGKDVVASILHRLSSRRDQPFIKINCSAISESLFESELFGYEKGSFTGALKEGKAGYFEAADQGTLFLDEIGDMPLSSQVKLLRVLQAREVTRIGSSKPIPVDVRIILATNRNLREMVAQGRFREDLYYRINIVNLYVPPLRERRDSICPLAENFLRQYNKKYHVQKRFSSSAKEALTAYRWPGNIREMENLIQRLLLCVEGNLITEEDLEREFQKGESDPVPADGAQRTAGEPDQEDEETRYRSAAASCRSTREMARLLQTSQSTVVRRLKKYGITLGERESDS